MSWRLVGELGSGDRRGMGGGRGVGYATVGSRHGHGLRWDALEGACNTTDRRSGTLLLLRL